MRPANLFQKFSETHKGFISLEFCPIFCNFATQNYVLMEATKILYIAQEIVPYVPESEIANLCRKLPQSVQEKSHEVRLFMPKFGHINERRNQLHEVIRLSGQNIDIDDTDHPLFIKVASIPAAHMQVYFIDNEDFFVRKGILGEKVGEEFEDNDERMIFFARGVIETVKKLRWEPEVIHCHGWFSALLPFYLKKAFNNDPFFQNAKIVYSLYNESFKNPLCDRFVDKSVIEGLSADDLAPYAGKALSYNDLMKFALDFSDAAIIGSENVDAELVNYAKEHVKHVLPYQPAEASAEAYCTFYDEISK